MTTATNIVPLPGLAASTAFNPGRENTTRQVIACIEALLAEVSGGTGGVSPADDLAVDLGLDWIDLAVIFSEVEEHFGIEISPAEEQRVRTIGDLAELVEGKVAPPGEARA